MQVDGHFQLVEITRDMFIMLNEGVTFGFISIIKSTCFHVVFLPVSGTKTCL